MKKTFWQDGVNLALGIWLFIAPPLGVGPTDGFAAWNGYLVGVAVVVVAWAGLVRPEPWKEWTLAGIGLWLMMAPWLLAYHFTATAATWNHVIAGFVLAAAALSALREMPVSDVGGRYTN